MKRETVDKRNLQVRVCAPRGSHQVKAVPSGKPSRRPDQIPVRLPSRCSDAADGAPRTFVMAVRPPAGVGET